MNYYKQGINDGLSLAASCLEMMIEGRKKLKTMFPDFSGKLQTGIDDLNMALSHIQNTIKSPDAANDGASEVTMSCNEAPHATARQ